MSLLSLFTSPLLSPWSWANNSLFVSSGSLCAKASQLRVQAEWPLWHLKPTAKVISPATFASQNNMRQKKSILVVRQFLSDLPWTWNCNFKFGYKTCQHANYSFIRYLHKTKHLVQNQKWTYNPACQKWHSSVVSSLMLKQRSIQYTIFDNIEIKRV